MLHSCLFHFTSLAFIISQWKRCLNRLGDDELRRFYAAVNGDFSKLILAVKKTIRWRQSYKLFQPQELEAWSHFVFWHGNDLQQRPCLIIRLGLACSNLQSNDRQLFIKAVGMHFACWILMKYIWRMRMSFPNADWENFIFVLSFICQNFKGPFNLL